MKTETPKELIEKSNLATSQAQVEAEKGSYSKANFLISLAQTFALQSIAAMKLIEFEKSTPKTKN